MNVYTTCTEIKQNVHALHLTRVHDSSGIMFTAEKNVVFIYQFLILPMFTVSVLCLAEWIYCLYIEFVIFLIGLHPYEAHAYACMGL